MIGPFPWDPFPPGEPDPKGPDPIHAIAYRAAVTGADAYHSVRLALRRELGVLRLGNRFVPDGRFREVAFLALGNAANSMALAALHVLGDRLTQGYIAGPEPVAPELPFRGRRVAPGWGGAAVAVEVVAAASEIVAGLRESDLLLVLLSPGAVRGLARPPIGLSADDFGSLLERAHTAGASGRECGLLARVLGSGAVGGRLLPVPPRGEVATLIVDRGDSPALVGGGPLYPIRPDERVEARSALERVGLAAEVSRIPGASDALSPSGDAAAVPRNPSRALWVANPSDALRPAADAVFEKGWTVRLAFLRLEARPEEAADRFLARTEELLRAEPLDVRTKGLATLAMTTLDLPEGPDEGPAFQEFLVRANAGIRRREMSVGLFRTGGTVGAPEFPGGAVMGAPTDRDAKVPPGRARAVAMRSGITDVGLLAVALCPSAEPEPRSTAR